MNPQLLAGRLVLITGASRGIGYFTALECARLGAHVIALARTIGGLEELDDEIKKLGGEATLVPISLTDYEALDRLGASVFERWGKLDGLICNAGVLGPISPLGHIPPEEWDEVISVNLTANWRLIRSMDPLLRQSDAGRVVLFSSGAAHAAKPFWSAYAASKAALEELGKTYAHEMATTPVNVTLVNPGRTRTAMRAKAAPGEDPMTLPHPSEVAAKIPPLCAPSHDANLSYFDCPLDELHILD